MFDGSNRMVPSGGCTPNLSTYCFDISGDLLKDNQGHVYTYDVEARIKTVDGTVALYTYGPDGDRVRKDANGTATEYIYFGGGVIAEKNPATGAWTDYIFGYGGKRIAKDTSANGSAAQYYQDDHLGTTRIMTDASGTVISNCTFNAFGEQISCSPDNTSNHYRYAGKERDTETGLDDFGARYYSSTMGRWTTPDWSGRPMTIPYADFGDPQSLNLYLYVRNDPIGKADADGHIENDATPDQPVPNSCLDDFACYDQYQQHMKDNQPGGWFSLMTSASSDNGDSPGDNSDEGQSTGTVPVVVGQRPIHNKVAQFFSILFTFHRAYHSYYRVTGSDGVTHQFEVLGDPGSSHNQQVRDTFDTNRQSGATPADHAKEHTIYVSEAQAQRLINGSNYFLNGVHPCPTCTGGQEGYNLIFHNSNSFVFNMLSRDPAGSIPPPPAPSITPGYALKPDDWYPNP